MDRMEGCMKAPTVDEMRDMFRLHTAAAVKVIVDIMTNGSGAKGEAVRLAAAKEILNRGWGRPAGPKDKDKDKDTAPADPRPVWRSPDGKTFEQVYAEKAAEVLAAVKPPAAPPGNGAIAPPPR
jgi:hypothetical protein